jgi:glycosyltransferase involved in cell wall biosynthesis
MKIAFIHNQKAFLPELIAYRDFFRKQNIQTCEVKYGEEVNSGADVFWYMMGFYPKSKYKNKIIIHEYASASVPPYRRWKDFLKKTFHPGPDFRIFLDEYVQSQIGISDEVPSGFRNTGVQESWLLPSAPVAKDLDFIYIGSLSRHRQLTPLLKKFTQSDLSKKTLTLLGKDEEGLAKEYAAFPNIHFQDAVGWEEIPGWVRRSRFALNFIPDREPFNAVVPLKFLEYAALKTPIISTNVFSVVEFKERFGGNYFLLKEDLSNLSWERLLPFSFEYPDLHHWTWEEQIGGSGILEFLRLSAQKRTPRFN